MKKATIIGILSSFVVLASCTYVSTLLAKKNEHIPDTTVSSIKLSDTDASQQSDDTIEAVALVDGHAPLLACFSACGIQIEWIDEDHAYFIRDKKYLISIIDKSIMAEGSSFNIVTPPPGTVDGYIETEENEIYVDLETLYGVFSLLHMDRSELTNLLR